MAAVMGLTANLDPWRKGVRNAGDIVKKGLGDRSLTPFNRAVVKSARDIRAKLGGALSAVTSRVQRVLSFMTSVRGVIVGIAGAAVLGKVVGWMQQAVDLSREVADSWSRVELSARTGFPELDTAGLRKYGEEFSRAFGLGMSETFDSISKFMTGGATGEQLKGLLQLAVDFSAKTGKSLEQSVKMVQDASQGRLDSLREAQFVVQGTGDAAIDAATALKAMQDHAAGAAATITNPSERLQRSLENIKATIGDRLVPILDPLVTKIDNILLGWEHSTINEDLQKAVETVFSIGKGVVWVGAKAMDLAKWIQESTAMLTVGTTAFLKSLRLVFVDGTHWIFLQAKAQVLKFTVDLLRLLPFGLGESIYKSLTRVWTGLKVVGASVLWLWGKGVEVQKWLVAGTANVVGVATGVMRTLQVLAVDGTTWIVSVVKEKLLTFLAELPGLLPFGLGEKLLDAMGGKEAVDKLVKRAREASTAAGRTLDRKRREARERPGSTPELDGLDKLAKEADLAASLAKRDVLGGLRQGWEGVGDQWDALKAARDALHGAGPNAGSRLNDRLAELEAQGAGIRAASMESITAQAAASAGGAGGLVNPGVYEEKQRQDEERRAQEREEWMRRREEQMEAAAAARESSVAPSRVRGVGNVGEGSQVRVTIMSARGDKFRKQGRRR